MSGVLVDVDARTDKANKGLDAVNRNLEKLAIAARKSNAALGEQKPNTKLVAEARRAEAAYAAVGKAGAKMGASVASGAESAAQGMQGVITLAKAAAAAFLAIKGTGAFNKVADDLQNIQNRLSLVIKDTDKLIQKQQQLYRISRDARADFGTTAGMYVDFAKSLGSLGVAEQRITRVVGLIQKSNAMAGSSPEAIKGAMIQLQQGIAAGTIRGEELNSIMEQSKYLATGLMDELGKNAGSLRKFAEEGNLTTDLVINNVEKLDKKITTDF